MIVTVTKRFVSVPTLFDTEKVTLTAGTELDLHPVIEDGEPNKQLYVGTIANDSKATRQPVKLTAQELAMWCVVRHAHDLGYQ